MEWVLLGDFNMVEWEGDKEGGVAQKTMLGLAPKPDFRFFDVNWR